jgi:DNA-binding GntR family transcriptional regulator
MIKLSYYLPEFTGYFQLVINMASIASTKKPRKAALPELVVEIHQHLYDQKFAPGFHVTAQALGTMFNVSRWTASKALEYLAEKGVVTHKKEHGYYVAQAIAMPLRERLSSGTTKLNTIYFRMAEERLSGDLPNQVTETYLRQRYSLTAAELSSLLHRISKEGWIERRTGYGWCFSVVLATPQALQQLYRLRLAIEPAALMEPGFHMEPSTIARLRAANEEILHGAAETLAADVLYERGVDFHESIARASQNPFFLDALRRINAIRRLLVYQSMARRVRFYGQAEGHLQILDLIEINELATASETMRQHLEGAIAKVSADVVARK